MSLINVNELLSRELINMKDYNKKTEEEIKNKKLLISNWVIFIISIVFYFSIVLLADFTLEEGLLLGTIIFISTILLVIICYFAFRTDIDVGYYECEKCHHKFTPTYKEAMFVPVYGEKRDLKCPKCNKKTWTKKVMSK